MMDYDLIIVGGGPTGLMAAKTAAKQGLSILVIEKRPNISVYKRACSAMFHNSPGMNNQTVTVRRNVDETTWHFKEDNFSIKYTGGIVDFYDYFVFSPSGHRLHMHRIEKPLGICFDFNTLLRDLLTEAADRGVSFLTSSLGIKAENIDGGARVLVKQKNKEFYVTGKKVIAADGLASRIVENAGLNKDRYFYAKGPSIQYVVENVKCPYPPAWMRFHGADYTEKPGMIYMVPSAAGKNLYNVGAGAGLPGRLSKNAIDHFMTKSRFASWFSESRVVEKTGCCVTMYSPLKTPYIGNILFLGETIGFAETLVQGAVLCGYKGAKAVVKEFSDGTGFSEYEKFWNNSFQWMIGPEWQADYAKTAFFYPFFNDEELDYMLKFTNDRDFLGELNPYKSPINFMTFMKDIDGVDPKIMKKIEMYKALTIKDIQMIVEKMKKEALRGGK